MREVLVWRRLSIARIRELRKVVPLASKGSMTVICTSKRRQKREGREVEIVDERSNKPAFGQSLLMTDTDVLTTSK